MEYDKVIELDSWDEFKRMRYDSGRHFKLTSDIDLEETPGIQLRNFRGILEGNGHKIKNINSPSDEIMPSLIDTNKGIIKNVKFKGIKISSNDKAVGGICTHNKGVIKNCRVEGNLKSKKAVAGISLYSTGKINNCKFEGRIKSDKKQVGGIVEKNHDGIVENCHTSGHIISDFFIGGVIADNEGMVKSCSSDVTIKNGRNPKGHIGGLIGINNGQLFKSYFYGNIELVKSSKKRGGLIAGKNGHTIRNCYSVHNDYPLIAINDGISEKNHKKQDVEEIESNLVAITI